MEISWMTDSDKKQNSGKAAFVLMFVFSFFLALSVLFTARFGAQLIYDGSRFLPTMIGVGATALFLFLAWICRVPYKKAGHNKFNEDMEKWRVFFAFAILVAAFMALYFGFKYIDDFLGSVITGEHSNLYTSVFVSVGAALVALFIIFLFRPVKSREHIRVLSLKYEPFERILREKKPWGFAKVINALTPFVICIYALMVILPWVCHPYDGLYELLNDGTPALIYRACEAGFFIVWMVLIMVSNRKAPHISKWLLFALMAGMLVFAIFTAETQYSFEYIQEDATKVLDVTLTRKDIFMDYLNVFFALVFAFSAMFIIPITKNSNHSKNAILWLFVAIGLASIVYSLVAEMNNYVEAFTDFHGKFANKVFSFFKSKNVFGVVLMLSFIASTVLAFQKKMFLRVLLLIYTGITVLMEGIIFCTTAMVAGIVLWIVLLVWHFCHCIRKHPIATSICYALLISAAIVAVLFVTLPPLYEMNSVLSALNKTFFKTRFSDRGLIWQSFFENMEGNHAIMGNGTVAYYYIDMIKNHVVSTTPMHNGYIDVFNRGGAVYFAFYAFILAFGFKQLHELRKSGQKQLALSIMAIGIATMVYSVAETCVIGLNSSLVSLLPTIVFLSFPIWFRPEYKKEWLSQSI